MLHVAARVSGLHTIHTVWIVGVVVTLAWASAPLLISGAAVGFTVSRGQCYGDASSRARRHRDAIRSTLVAASWSEATSKP